MHRQAVSLLFLVLSLAACSLNSAAPASEPLPTNLPTSNVKAAPTNTSPPAPSNTAIVASQPASIPCTPRTDWQQYTVKAGDTMSQIAAFVGLPVATVASANCLADANLIEVGQQLYVPVQPEPPRDFAMDDTGTRVTVAPLIAVESFGVVVNPGEIVTFSWTGAPANATSVEFYLQRLDIPVSVEFIGVDNNLSDGASIQWKVISIHAAITATAKQGNQVVNQTAESLQIKTWSESDVPGTVAVAPVLRDNAGWGVLPAGQVVTVTWPYAAKLGDVQVHFYAIRTGTNSVAEEIGSDHNVYDGAAVQWVVPAGFTGYLFARAGTKGGAVLVSQTDSDLPVTTE